LFASGFSSIAAVRRAGKAAFVAQMSSPGSDGAPGKWPRVKAEQIFGTLTIAHQATFLGLIGGLVKTSEPPAYALSGASKPASAAAADLAGLAFTSACACANCRSVLSQSAYLADLLHFLDEAAPKDGLTPLQVLLKRRPDLQEVLFDCANEKLEL